ncbi:MAG: stage III sporulation protein AE [Christensenellales bacterium]
MKRAVLAAALLLALLLPSAAFAEESTVGEMIDGELSKIEAGGLDDVYEGLPDAVRSIFGEENFLDLVGSLAKGEPVQAEGVFSRFLSLLGEKLKNRLALVTALFALAALCGIAAEMRRGVSGGAGEIAGLVCYVIAVIVAVYAFTDTVTVAKEAAMRAQSIMEIAFPLLLTLLTAAGATASAGLFSPATALLTTGVTTIFTKILLPAVLAMGVCAIVGNLSEQRPLDKLTGLFKSTIKWTMGILSTLYIGYLGVMGIAAKSADGLSVRAVRYAADKLIPIVGTLVSGSVDTLLACSLLVKNALGAGAVLLMAGVLVSPLLDIMTLQIAFRISAAIIEPIADARLTKGISALADVLTYLFAILAGIGVMFALTVGLIAAAGNALL